MEFRFNPYRAAFFGLLLTFFLIYRWVQKTVDFSRLREMAEEMHPNQAIVILAMFLITLVGLVRLLLNMRDPE